MKRFLAVTLLAFGMLGAAQAQGYQKPAGVPKQVTCQVYGSQYGVAVYDYLRGVPLAQTQGPSLEAIKNDYGVAIAKVFEHNYNMVADAVYERQGLGATTADGIATEAFEYCMKQE